MTESPRVVDLFCGGGGFSEGFRRAGFEIVWASDIDSDACQTFSLNHPDTTVVNKDISEVSIGELPEDIDVLIGSPPCTEFSYAKNGGGGDIDEGMRLVGEFFRFVAELDVDHWVMENVPRLDDYLDQQIEFSRIPSIDRNGTLEIPTKEVLLCSNYGTPQRRNRLFSGAFTKPEPLDDEAMSLGKLHASFPSPLEKIEPGKPVLDPLYDIEITQAELSDHFYNSYLTKREATEIQARKQDHSYYGKMSFPDDSEVPSRSVLATNRRIARETLVLEENRSPQGFSRYRKPTIREIASIQGFPITYQFTGNSLAKKWRRVGDAVPPTVAYHIANEIRKDMGLQTMETERRTRPALEHDLNDEDFEIRGRRKLSLSRSFRHHVPMDRIREYRVDIETDKDQNPRHPASEWTSEDLNHPVKFQVHFYQGYAKEVSDELIGLDEALEYLENINNLKIHDRVAELLETLDSTFGNSVPDATTVQAIRSRRFDSDELDDVIEFKLLDEIGDFVDDHFPPMMYGDWEVKCGGLMGGIEVPGRVLMKLVTANYVVWKMNHGARWIIENPEGWYLKEDVKLTINRSDVAEALESKGPPDKTLQSRVVDFCKRLSSEHSPGQQTDD